MSLVGKTGQCLKGVPWFEAEEVQKVFAILNGDKQATAIVGGAIRNHLLGSEVNDIDFATTLRPEEVMRAAKKAGQKTIPTGQEHGTITLITGSRSFEITTLRRDVKTDGRHAQVEFGKDWHADAQRRDFTINALYLDHEGYIYDPLDNGLEDIKQRKIRFIGDPVERIREDHLRILRLYRFAAYYADEPIDADAIRAVVGQARGLKTLSRERVRDELLKLLAAPNPGWVIKKMQEDHILDLLLATRPAIEKFSKLCEIEKNLGLKPDPLLRLGTLAGAGEVKPDKLTHHFALSNRQQATLKAFTRAAMITRDFKTTAKPERAAQKIAHYRLGLQGYLVALISAWLECPWPPDDEGLITLYNEVKSWASPEFPLKGRDLIKAGLQPGPKMGRLLSELETLWLNEGMQIQRSELLGIAKASINDKQK